MRLILSTLKNLVFKGQGVDDVTGPVGTVYVIQEVTQQGGFEVYLELLALISVNLGVMNLLPIPGLDGSRLLFLLAEAIRRKAGQAGAGGRDSRGGLHAADGADGAADVQGHHAFLCRRDSRWRLSPVEKRGHQA